MWFLPIKKCMWNLTDRFDQNYKKSNEKLAIPSRVSGYTLARSPIYLYKRNLIEISLWCFWRISFVQTITIWYLPYVCYIKPQKKTSFTLNHTGKHCKISCILCIKFSFRRNEFKMENIELNLDASKFNHFICSFIRKF